MARLDDRHFASGGRDCRIRLWTDSGVCTGELAGHTQSVLGLTRIDAKHLASVVARQDVATLGLDTKQCLVTPVAPTMPQC